jgi:hypothetical protein
MKGYVKNIGRLWRHALKHSISPGEKISLDLLFEEYGAKHGFEPGRKFADWIMNVKLKDPSVWEVVYEDEIAATAAAVVEATDAPPAPEKNVMPVTTSPIMKKDFGVIDIINMSVRTARADLRKMTDLNLLKHALSEARQLAGKDTLCIMLRRRISELEITRR